MREKLIELLTDDLPHADNPLQFAYEEIVERLADYLLANGVVVLMRDGNDFNPDVYCSYCGNNLTAAWEEEENENP